MTKYIYQQKEWPHFIWDTAQINGLLINLRHKQGLLIGKMKALGLTLQNEATLESLTREVMTTNAIEGTFLNNKEVRSSLAKRLGIEFGGMVPTGRAVDGVVEVMLDATQKFDNKLTKERLFGWHSALFLTGHSGVHQITVGKWRTDKHGPMQVVSGVIGRDKVHYEAPSASEVGCEMEAFLRWFNSGGCDAIDLLLKAAIAHFWFITIHPFEDGNGRIARAIAEMVLARADNSHHRFYSMSEQIEKSRKDYYDILEQSQKGSLDITMWMKWFLNNLEVAIDGSEELIGDVLRKDALWCSVDKAKLNDRQQKIINLLLDRFDGKLTTSRYAKITKCSQDTALRDIKELIESGILEQSDAGGRSTNYKLKELN